MRNAQARNIMRGMALGDEAFFYHSSCKVSLKEWGLLAAALHAILAHRVCLRRTTAKAPAGLAGLP